MDAVVPFLAVADMQASLSFYVDGLGFEMKQRWEDDGVLRWCRLEHGQAAVMLQQYREEGHDARRFSDNKGDGIMLAFFCPDAVAYYQELRQRAVDASEPAVGNGMWSFAVTDPDGFRLAFESYTDATEGMTLSQALARAAPRPR